MLKNRKFWGFIICIAVAVLVSAGIYMSGPGQAHAASVSFSGGTVKKEAQEFYKLFWDYGLSEKEAKDMLKNSSLK